jgi:hypothetical protein
VVKFLLGRILFTRGVLALEIDIFSYLKRHAQGNYGDVERSMGGPKSETNTNLVYDTAGFSLIEVNAVIRLSIQ